MSVNIRDVVGELGDNCLGFAEGRTLTSTDVICIRERLRDIETEINALDNAIENHYYNMGIKDEVITTNNMPWQLRELIENMGKIPL